MNTVARARLGAAFDAAVARLATTDRRLLLAVLAALAVFAAFEGWVLLLRAPLAEYRSLSAVRLATQAVAGQAGLDAEIDRLTRRSAAQARELAAAGAVGANDDDALLALIETLSELAVRHGVVLGRVNPLPPATVGDFEERSHSIDARGDYRALHRWLSEAQRALAPAVVAELALRSVEGGPRIAATLRLASYRPAASASGAAP